MFYINNNRIHSKTFEKHFYHLDTVIGKLTKAGFTLNTEKYHFCCQEVKFLGHCIDKTGISVDPDHAVAVLNHPALKNTKQLVSSSGHVILSRFIVGYANYGDPHLSLLKQGTQ
jgi:hypothetical protein